ncbi:hypothetical protein PR202_ga01857 [Eleusine coracana subsp. coracana]|uniref:Uncharacterized protein n=1 Tax=Eleusine coracana subsp. coracana TaxID=191504 RepID=A0AAV5BG42_ELECO|nr:hypothetical protein PR202_ga01170 [Eleusine coracana subsp. coracana]GJM86039.1 hypothetical protein PR202_ga01857 [Eleusine coracana subsp. coracana]
MAAFPASLVLVLLVILRVSVGAAPDAAAVVSRIAFGSCANQSAPQPIWDAIAGFDPHVFIWLGDNVYGDNKRPFRVFGRERTVGPWKNVPRFYPSTEEELRGKYELAKAQPGYARLREKAQVSYRQALSWCLISALIVSSSSIVRYCFVLSSLPVSSSLHSPGFVFSTMLQL